MKSAPPVVYPVGRSLMQPLAWGLCLPLSIWLWQPWGGWAHWEGHHVWGAVALQGLLLWSVWSVRSTHSAKAKALHWDGAGWQVEWAGGEFQPVHVSVHADGGHFLWVSVQLLPPTTDRPRRQRLTLWLLQRAHDNSVRWHGFRCAVYCRTQT